MASARGVVPVVWYLLSSPPWRTPSQGPASGANCLQTRGDQLASMVLRDGRWLTVLVLVPLISSRSTAAMDRHAEHLIAQLRKRPACSALIVVRVPPSQRLSFASDGLASYATVRLRPAPRSPELQVSARAGQHARHLHVQAYAAAAPRVRCAATPHPVRLTVPPGRSNPLHNRPHPAPKP